MAEMNAPLQDASGSYYLKHQKVYPREVQGRFARLRTLSVWVLLGIFYLLPWLQWGDRQAVLFDLPARKFFIFGLVFWPQDFIFLTWLLIIAALALFFFTAVGGRLWCGCVLRTSRQTRVSDATPCPCRAGSRRSRWSACRACW